jgi:hypothetical protein
MSRKMRRVLIVLGVFAVVLLGAGAVTHALYHGPRTMAQVMAVMPGVPIFPLAAVAPGNALGQQIMAIPLWRLRRAGAGRAETVLLAVPADREFVIEWYELVSPKAGWTLSGKVQDGQTTRLFFTRSHDGFQVLIGSNNDLICAYQIIYLQRISTELLKRLSAEYP